MDKKNTNGQTELKSANLLLPFIAYCEAHPDERFWQALRNFTEADFIFRGHMNSKNGGERVIYDTLPVYLKDTFNEE